MTKYIGHFACSINSWFSSWFVKHTFMIIMKIHTQIIYFPIGKCSNVVGHNHIRQFACSKHSWLSSYFVKHVFMIILFNTSLLGYYLGTFSQMLFSMNLFSVTLTLFTTFYWGHEHTWYSFGVVIFNLLVMIWHQSKCYSVLCGD